MVWKYESFKSDSAIYAFCPRCNFYHDPSRLVTDEEGKFDIEVVYQYHFCPNCGEYLFDDSEMCEVIWKNRHVDELYNNIMIDFPFVYKGDKNEDKNAKIVQKKYSGPLL